jgi:hypothetical protein
MQDFSRAVSSYNKLVLTVEGGRELVAMVQRMLDAYDNGGKDMEIPEGATRKSIGGVDNLDILMFEDADIGILIDVFSDMALNDHMMMNERIESLRSKFITSQN